MLLTIFDARNICLILALLFVSVATSGEAGQQSGDPPGGLDGPPVPVAPAVIARDAEGRVTIRAHRIETRMDIDGRLDEPIYTSVRAMSDYRKNRCMGTLR